MLEIIEMELTIIVTLGGLLITGMFVTGYILGKRRATGALSYREKRMNKQTIISDRDNSIAFKSEIEHDMDEIVKLENGSIIELESGSTLYSPIYNNCILYKDKSNLKIWIEDNGLYDCKILKEPSSYFQISVIKFKITNISEDGEYIRLNSGRVFKVDYDSLTTYLWSAHSVVLLIDCSQLINLDTNELVEVSSYWGRMHVFNGLVDDVVSSEKKTKNLTRSQLLYHLAGSTVTYEGEEYIVGSGGFMEPRSGRIISWNMLSTRNRINLKKQRKAFLEYLYYNR